MTHIYYSFYPIHFIKDLMNFTKVKYINYSLKHTFKVNQTKI